MRREIRGSNNTDTTVIVRQGGTTVKIALGIVGIAAVVIIAFLYQTEFGLVMLGLGGVAVWRGIVWVNNTRLSDNNRKLLETVKVQLAQRKADLLAERVAQEQQKTAAMAFAGLFHQTNVGVFRLMENGSIAYYPATVTERNRQMQLPAKAGEAPVQPLDFYRVMTDGKAAYAVIGAQRVGKSYVAMRLTEVLPGNTLIIGVKMEDGEWPNCRQYIGLDAAEYALELLVEEVKKRHNPTGKYRTPRLNVFLDDWINLAAILGETAEEFFVHAATDMLSAGIVPYFLLQSDSKTDWGTKHGAQLKNNFTKLFLTPYREAGKIDPTKTRGRVEFPGEKESYPVNLPGGLPELGPSKYPVSLPKTDRNWEIVTVPEDAQDAEFVRLVQEEDVSRREAALKVYGRDYAGNIVSRGRRALGEIE